MSNVHPGNNESSTGERKKYRAIGQAYDRLFKAPPPQASVKSEKLAKEMATGDTPEASQTNANEYENSMVNNPEEGGTNLQEELMFQPNNSSVKNEQE